MNLQGMNSRCACPPSAAQIAASTSFPGGITNGADWYAIYGGMQDWTYVKAGVFHVTLELWDPKGGPH